MSGAEPSHRTAAAGPGTGDSDPGGAGQGRKRRRWKRWILIAAVAAGGLIFALPYLLSTGPGTALVVSIANRRVDGHIEVEDLSLRWLGPCRVTGLRVADPAGREVLNVDEIDYAPGVLQAIRSWERLKQVTVDAPRLVLYVHRKGMAGGTSLGAAFAWAGRRKYKAADDTPAPPISGKVRIRSGSVRIVLADGRSVTIEDIDGEFDLASLDEIAGTLSVVLPGEAKLTASFDMKGLAPGGRLKPNQASGRFDLTTHGAVDLAPVVRMLGVKGVTGRGSVKIASTFAPEKLSADVALLLSRLAASAGPARTARPIERVELSGKVIVAGTDLRTDLTAASGMGSIRTRGSYRLDQPSVRVEAGQLRKAVLTGGQVALPEFECGADGSVDLAALASVMPDLLRVRRDATVTGGTLEIKDLFVRGGRSPRARGQVAARGLRVRRGEQAVAIEPVTVEFDAGMDPQQGVRIHKTTLTSETARATADGTIRSLRVAFESDLEKLWRAVSQFVDLGKAAPLARYTGTARGQVWFGRPTQAATVTTAGRLKIFGFRVDGKALSSEAVQVEWGDARIDPAGRSFAARSARVRCDFLKADVADAAVRLGDVPEVQGRLSVEADLPAVRAAVRPWRTWPDGPDPRGLLKLTGNCKTLDGTYHVQSTAELIDPAGGARTAGLSVNGFYGLASGGFRVQVASDGFDLAPVAAQAEAFGAKLPAPPAGRVAIKATATRADADAPVVTSGSLQATGLHVGGTEISGEPVKATWADLRVSPAGRSLVAKTVHVTGEPMELTAEDVSVDLAGEAAITGRLDADVDLGRCLALARGFVEPGRLPRITGRLTLRGQCAARDGRASFDGEGRIRGGAGGERVMLWVAGKGFHEKESGAAGATVKLTRLNLAYLALAVEPFGPEGLKGLAGTVAGNVEITRAGADAPIVATGSASGTDLAVDAKAVPGGHLKLRWIKAGYLPATKDLSVKSVLLESDLAGVNGQDIRVRWGREVTAAGKLNVTADLAACHAAARPFVKLPDGPAPTGWLTLAGTFRTADGRIEMKSNARIRELRRRAGDQGLPVLTADVEGWYAARTGALGGDVNVSRADVAYLGRLAQTLGREGMAAYGGVVQVRSTFGRRASGAPIAAGGAGRLTGLSVDARPVAGADADFEWSGARIGAAGKDVAVALAKLTSALASVSARDVQCRFGKDLTADGKLTVRADLERCLAVARPVAGWKQTPPVAGRLEANATVRSGGGNVDLAASGRVDNFRYGTGAKVVQDKRIDFGVDARVSPSNQIIALKAFKIDSKLLAATAAGTVWEYRTRRVIDLKGEYRIGWDAVMAVLHAFKPATADTVLVRGESASAFTAAGPLYEEGMRPPFGWLNAGAKVGWSSAKVYGVALDGAALSARMGEGKMTLPVAVIGASGGTVRVGGVVDFTGAEPVLRIGRLAALEDVPVSVEVGELILSRFNPIFGKVNVARLDGRMSLSLRDIAVPLSESIRRAGTGAGRLDMQTVRLAPTGVLGELVRLGGLDRDAQAVKVSGADFTIRQGRIWYKDFAVVFANEFDLRFSGSVGFDDTLDLIVRVPVRTALLQKLGIKGRIAQYAAVLEGEYVAVPLRGTRAKPRLDWKRVDIRPLIQRAIRSIILGRERKRADGAGPPAKTPEQEALDSILDLLKKAAEDRKKK